MTRKPQWTKQTLPLKANATWKAPPGYSIFVADRGAVRFNVPDDWMVEPQADCIALFDPQPPNDNCKLTVSYLRLPPAKWSALPLARLLTTIVEGDPREVVGRGDIITLARADLDVAWTELRFLDAHEHREAASRFGLARGANVQALLTLDLWPEDAPRVGPV